MKPILKKIINWIKPNWRWLITAIVIVGLAVFTLSLQINTIVPGQNQFEKSALANIDTFPNPLHRSVNAPYNMVAFAAGKILGNPLYGARLTSVLFALMAAVCFFYLIKMWFNWRMATIGTCLFITSSWMLNFSHQAAPISVQVFAPLLALIAFTIASKAGEHKERAFIAFAASLALAAYIPYTPWVLIVALTIFIIKQRRLLLKMPSKAIIFSAAVYLILLTPLFISLSSHPGQILELFGLPSSMPAFSVYFKQLGNLILSIAIRSPFIPEIHLDHLPILDIFTATMFVFGLYYFIRRLPKLRSLIIVSSLVLLTLILPISPNYQYNVAVLLPLIYICVATGIVKMLKLWYQYFPRNPLARNIGVCLLVAVIGFSCYYNLRAYFIAWPNSSDTKAVYVMNSSQAPAKSNHN
jgi:hypothetical protein